MRASPAAWHQLRALEQRQRRYLIGEILQVRDLMPLLMKRRNGEHWTAPERAHLVDCLRHLSHVAPYLVVLALPGSFLLLPLLAWWLDRRRRGLRASPRASGTSAGDHPRRAE